MAGRIATTPDSLIGSPIVSDARQTFATLEPASTAARSPGSVTLLQVSKPLLLRFASNIPSAPQPVEETARQCGGGPPKYGKEQWSQDLA